MKTKAMTKKPAKTKLVVTPTAAIPLPALEKGEHWAGVILNKDGAPNHHLILLADESERVTWPKAKKWAAEAGTARVPSAD